MEASFEVFSSLFITVSAAGGADVTGAAAVNSQTQNYNSTFIFINLINT